MYAADTQDILKDEQNKTAANFHCVDRNETMDYASFDCANEAFEYCIYTTYKWYIYMQIIEAANIRCDKIWRFLSLSRLAPHTILTSKLEFT